MSSPGNSTTPTRTCSLDDVVGGGGVSSSGASTPKGYGRRMRGEGREEVGSAAFVS